ncbi:putative alpha-1,2-mannosidase [Anaerohalosphaera lusitana]|uniref:Putative alpha-1,2-mannosidase n=1 Tax=Anaerohalosphaera lusitana TaxID=1936003 RepID=A0A1U9NPT2_9BACT|nr:GH92 family glycosyl hydrolase [Anaerohalosphaera lusitana]AQT69797.1 putative alpha-1,2-mannosidase [Anaerohalosphaera lusitana]
MTHNKATTIILVFLGIAMISGCGVHAKSQDVVQYVDPYIGTSGHGHTFLAATVPFGAIQPGPNGFNKGWDWCSGYHYSDSVLVGFSHTHLSGTGIGDLGDIMMMPFTGEIKTQPGSDADPDSGYASRFSHDNETARPSHYSVKLDDYDVKVDLTATERVAMHKYTFPADKTGHVIVDLQQGNTDHATKTYIRQIDDTTFGGYRFSTGWAKDQRVYFAMKFQNGPRSFTVYDGARKLKTNTTKSNKIKGVFTLDADSEPVLLKVAISPVSVKNALGNIRTEMPHWDFMRVVEQGREEWNRQLSCINIESGSDSVKRTFYTALYHTMIAPVLFNDSNGQYRGTDKKVYADPGFENYSIFSLWDTYRAQQPLLTITEPQRVDDMVKSMLAIYDQQGVLPVWHLLGNETWTMVGYHAVPVIVDAYMKGFDGFDPERAFEAIKTSAMHEREGVEFLKEMGYIPGDKENEAVAKALEYAIDDACIALMAEKLGKTEDAQYFRKRALAYAEYFDPTTKFMRGKMADGSWRKPFDPVASTHRKDDYCEGNAWQYTWLVPQHPEGLIDLFGSDQAFTEKLDRLWAVSSELSEGASSDISGLIGQYAHGNEPGHHISYLYAFAGQQYKTAEKVRRIMDTMYHDGPDGLCGNEDCGQMSAWYVFSALGFYPVHPAAGVYVLGSPALDEARIQIDGGETFTIRAENNSPENIYIQSASYNGKPYTKGYITHEMIVNGGTLVLQMGDTPNLAFASKPQNRSSSPLFNNSKQATAGHITAK